MCFIPLTQTYYAPGWRWPYECHKAGLMNMIVKAAAQYGLCGGKVIWYKACTAKLHAYKYGFGGVSKQLNYICCSLMDFFSPLELMSELDFSMLWDWIKENSFFGQGFVLCWREVGNPLPSTTLKFHYKHRAQLFFGLIAVINRVCMWPHMKVNDHWQVEYEFGSCSCLLLVHLTVCKTLWYLYFHKGDNEGCWIN